MSPGPPAGCRLPERQQHSFEPAPTPQFERYQWIEQTLRQFRYASRSKVDKGALMVYLCRISATRASR